MLSSILFTAPFAVMSLIFDNVASASARRLSGRDSDINNSYIVKLKDGINTTSHINSLPFLFSVEDENSPVTHWWPDFFIGYSGIFVGADLDAIRASSDIEYVEKNIIVRGSDLQTSAPWNLQAISTRRPVSGPDKTAMKYTYLYNQPVGDGVDIYIVDSGVYIEHSEFEGRATFGWAPPGVTMRDTHGHGTRMAAIAAGKTYGVAKNANIIAVKVLDNRNNGNIPNFISGLNWVSANVKRTGKPSIACLAFSSVEFSKGINEMTTILVGEGVTAVTAAGNYARDASKTSPASAPGAITVGASDIKNTMYPDSNFGSVVDIFAPGVDITSAGINSPDSTVRSSGTSGACAHVAGIAAYILSKDRTMTPYPIFQKILSLATKNVISGVPRGTTTDVVYNGSIPYPSGP